jgi:hypothetical protein
VAHDGESSVERGWPPRPASTRGRPVYDG